MQDKFLENQKQKESPNKNEAFFHHYLLKGRKRSFLPKPGRRGSLPHSKPETVSPAFIPTHNTFPIYSLNEVTPTSFSSREHFPFPKGNSLFSSHQHAEAKASAALAPASAVSMARPLNDSFMGRANYIIGLIFKKSTGQKEVIWNKMKIFASVFIEILECRA